MNETREKLIAEKIESEMLYNDLKEYYDKLRELRSRLIKENDDFRTRRMEHLNGVITEGVKRIFPERKLTVEVQCDFKRKNTVKLLLKDDNGNVFSPHISNGKLMQYLISFSAVTGIAKSLGVHNLFIDEAFGVASQNNLSSIGDIIDQKIVDDEMQIILVSQNPTLYVDLPRRQFELKYDTGEECAVMTDVKDFDRRD
jgi:hypothetical protein